MTETVIGLDKLLKDMGLLIRAASSDQVLDAVEAGATVIQIHAQENARTKLNKHPLGNLTNNIRTLREGKWILVGVFGVVYAKIHEFGGIIVPRRAPYLVFKVNGKTVRTKRVVMPARPYLRPAVDNNQNAIKDAIIEALVGLLKGSI